MLSNRSAISRVGSSRSGVLALVISEPAFPIPLLQTDLAMIGEFCAIQGQIETLIQRTAKLLLAVSDDAIMAILGSTSMRVFRGS